MNKSKNKRKSLKTQRKLNFFPAFPLPCSILPVLQNDMWRRQLLYQTLGTISYRRLLHSHFPPVVCMQSLTWLPALPSWSTQYKSTPYLCKDSDRTSTQRNQLKASTPTISTGERFVRYNQSRGSCKTCFQCKTFTRVVFLSCSHLQSALQKSVCVCAWAKRATL